MRALDCRPVVYIVFVLAVLPRPAATQSRADTVAVIAAALELVLVNVESAFYVAGTPDVVREAVSTLRSPSRVRERVGNVTVCDPALARADDNVGVDLLVSLPSGSVQPSSSARPELGAGAITQQGFEIDSNTAYVPVSTHCYMPGQGGGGLMILTLSDGRDVSIASGQRLCTIVRVGRQWRGVACPARGFI